MKDKLLYSAIGGCIGAVLTLTLTMSSPILAASQRSSSYDVLTCKDFYVVDDDDRILARIGKGFGIDDAPLDLYSRDKNRKIELTTDVTGGDLTINGMDDASMKLFSETIRFRSLDGRLEKVIAEDQVYTGVEWWNMILDAELDSQIRDRVREELRRY